MIAWITENIGTIVIVAVLALIVAGIIRSMIKDKDKGCSSCGGNCGNCKKC